MTMISLSGEVFVAIALDIRSRSSLPITIFLGPTNDYVGYISSQDDAGEGYEIVALRDPVCHRRYYRKLHCSCLKLYAKTDRPSQMPAKARVGV